MANLGIEVTTVTQMREVDKNWSESDYKIQKCNEDEECPKHDCCKQNPDSFKNIGEMRSKLGRVDITTTTPENAQTESPPTTTAQLV